jgi:hypothetical protein
LRAGADPVRPTTPADAPAIVELFAEVGIEPNARPQDLEWKYWQPYGDWPGSRSFLLNSGSKPLAHCGIIPRWCSWGTERISVLQPIDWVARTGAGGAGVALIKRLRSSTQLLLSVGGSEATLRIVPHMGFRRVDYVTGFARPLHPLRRKNGRSSVLPLLRVARAYAWKIIAPAARAPRWHSRPVSAQEAGQLEPVFPVSSSRLAVLGRSVELFRYMLSCPIVPFTLYAVEHAGTLRGYFLLASAPGQVRIADCWVSSEDPDDWRALILCAVAQAYQDPQAAEVVAWANDPLLTQALLAGGFQARAHIDVQILPSKDAQLPSAPIRVQLLDNDNAYLHEGEPEYWA